MFVGEHFTNRSPKISNYSQTLRMGMITYFYNGYYRFRVTINLNKVPQSKTNGFPGMVLKINALMKFSLKAVYL